MEESVVSEERQWTVSPLQALHRARAPEVCVFSCDPRPRSLEQMWASAASLQVLTKPRLWQGPRPLLLSLQVWGGNGRTDLLSMLLGSSGPEMEGQVRAEGIFGTVEDTFRRPQGLKPALSKHPL